MKTYELSAPDFEVLDKMMNNVLGNQPLNVLTIGDIARIDKLKDKFAGAFSCSLETEENDLDVGSMLERVKNLK